MRELRFRLRNGNTIVGYERWGGLEWEQSEDGEKWFATCFIPHQEKDQFTGLFDKQSKEIYEGDILRCDDSNEDHVAFNTEVWFAQGQFLTKHFGFPVHSWCQKKESWCEVIGNIYENPELLEETK